MPRCSIWIAITLSVTVWLTPAAAQTNPLSGDDWLTLQMLGSARPGKPVDDTRKRLLGLFANSDINGGGVSSADYKLHEQLKIARSRASAFTTWMQRDLDGDGAVTREELEGFFGKQARQPFRSSSVMVTPTPDQVKQVLDKLVGTALTVDANDDGTVTFDEMLAEARKQAEKRYGRQNTTAGLAPLTLDADGDGTVSRREYSEAVDRVLLAVDTDTDGQFSEQEIAALRERNKKLRAAAREEQMARQREAKRRELATACGLPKAPENVKIVLVGAYEGQALSTVSLGDDDQPVTVANVRIESGSEPLYVVLTSYGPMIWQFSGAVDRVALVAAGSTIADAGATPRVGIVGLPRERVHTVTKRGCLPYFSDAGKPKAIKTRGLVGDLIGRYPDFVFGHYDVSTVTLPAGAFDLKPAYKNTVAHPKSKQAAIIWKEMLRFNPGGLVRIDAKAVVSRVSASDYEVLPQEAGLAQLLERGALRSIGSASSKQFMIFEKIRVPAGLAGAHMVQFVLARGVPKPDGPLGHSCLLDEATGKSLGASTRCR